jgi:hypothetical protein
MVMARSSVVWGDCGTNPCSAGTCTPVTDSLDGHLCTCPVPDSLEIDEGTPAVWLQANYNQGKACATSKCRLLSLFLSFSISQSLVVSLLPLPPSSRSLSLSHVLFLSLCFPTSQICLFGWLSIRLSLSLDRLFSQLHKPFLSLSTSLSLHLSHCLSLHHLTA